MAIDVTVNSADTPAVDVTVSDVDATVSTTASTDLTVSSNVAGTGSGGTAWTQTTATSDYTASDNESIWADSSTSAVTITLPSPASSSHIRVVNIDDSNGVTLSENSSEGINDHGGSQSTITLADGESITVESDGSTWWVV